ncbi:MAG: hypothetical protein IPH45_19285 [Bacteroidales bacterium]|nr:hypothetical protein [Bacteroidales bacterium]
MERNVLEQVKTDMALINQVCLENRELRSMLHNPVINGEEAKGNAEDFRKLY